MKLWRVDSRFSFSEPRWTEAEIRKKGPPQALHERDLRNAVCCQCGMPSPVPVRVYFSYTRVDGKRVPMLVPDLQPCQDCGELTGAILPDEIDKAVGLYESTGVIGRK